jgi:hypothetical protein
MPLRGLGWPGGGRDVQIENQENRFADRNVLGERMGGDNLDNPGQLLQGRRAGQLRPAGWYEWRAGGKKKTNRTKGNKESGRRAGKRKLRAWIEGRFAGEIHALIPVFWRAILPSDEPTKRLNEQVKRNAERFPPSFMFQLTADEFRDLRSWIATTNGHDGDGAISLRSQNATSKRSDK